MGWWNGKEELFENNEIPYNKCSECGDYKEVSKKYICLLYTSDAADDQ